MATGVRSWLGGTAWTAAFILLVGVAVTGGRDPLFLSLLVTMVAAGAGFFHVAFVASRFFTFSLANCLGVYACIFVFFTDANFPNIASWAMQLGFTFPILSFLAGSWLRRREIERIIASPHVGRQRHFLRPFGWLVPVFAVGALTFYVPEMGLDAAGENALFLAAMLVIAAMVAIASRDVSSFLIYTGVLFDEFFERVAGLVVPAFAFFSFYSFVVIVFAAAYRLTDVASGLPHFRIHGETRAITFAESLYFSLVTLATVGYGDITPASDLTRVLSAIEVVVGVFLLLFGFYEITSYAREHRERRHDDRHE